MESCPTSKPYTWCTEAPLPARTSSVSTLMTNMHLIASTIMLTTVLGDLNIALTTYAYCEDCEVHSGFFDAMSEVKEYVLQNVQALLATYEPTYKVVVTGHSLGAALATLTSVELVYNNITASNGVILMNFGSPRVGNKKFAVYASKLLVHRYRVTHHKDIVPHLPWYPYYQHISGWYLI
ncbi:lipase family protein [archaeon]|nr:MAG: lipase family protein [archaeon]